MLTNSTLKAYVTSRLKTFFLKEEIDVIKGKTIVNVDIQPDYENYISFDLHEWAQFLNKSAKAGSRIVFLYNGYDSLGMVTESDYKYWLYDLGLKERVVSAATFFDKGYNFFRNPMDANVDSDEITALAKYMMHSNLNDSRDMDDEDWAEFIQLNPSCQEVMENLQNNDDGVNIPDVMDELRNYNNILLTGGGRDECLAEVEICLDAIDKPYQLFSPYTY